MKFLSIAILLSAIFIQTMNPCGCGAKRASRTITKNELLYWAIMSNDTNKILKFLGENVAFSKSGTPNTLIGSSTILTYIKQNKPGLRKAIEIYTQKLSKSVLTPSQWYNSQVKKLSAKEIRSLLSLMQKRSGKSLRPSTGTRLAFNKAVASAKNLHLIAMLKNSKRKSEFATYSNYLKSQIK